MEGRTGARVPTQQLANPTRKREPFLCPHVGRCRGTTLGGEEESRRAHNPRERRFECCPSSSPPALMPRGAELVGTRTRPTLPPLSRMNILWRWASSQGLAKLDKGSSPPTNATGCFRAGHSDRWGGHASLAQ